MCIRDSHRLEHDDVAPLDPAIRDRDVQRERNRGGGRVGVLIHRHHHLVGRKPEFARGRVENSGIRLMRNHPVDILGRQPGGLQRLAQHGCEIDHRVAEHLLSLIHI